MQDAVARAAAPRRVCLFGTYAREHTATVLLRQALAAMGCQVAECHEPLWQETRDKMPAYFQGRSLARLALAYARRAGALRRSLARHAGADLFVAGFNGQLDVFLFRLLRGRAPLLFAPLVTVTETIVDDRRVHRPRSPVAYLAAAVDRGSLGLADGVIIDTEAHGRYLIERHGVSADRVAVWHLGADREVFRPSPPPRRNGPLRGLFYGQFLPLHGVQTILAAMATLVAEDADAYEFTVVGSGPERAAAVDRVSGSLARRLRFIEWVPYKDLGRMVAAADFCFGSFGDSNKARMVIPNKVYQAAAVGRAVVTADTPAIREVFTPGEDIVTCAAADPAALASAVRRLRDDGERERLALAAGELMASRFSPEAHAARLREALRLVIEA